MRILFLGLALCVSLASAWAQPEYYTKRYQFSEADTLRGMLSPLRTCYDVFYYDLNIEVDIEQKYIRGYNAMHFTAKTGFNMLQFDLFENMQVDSVVYEGRALTFHRKHNAVFVDFGTVVPAETRGALKIFYQGKPIIAKQPPWDGGFSWDKDKTGKPWVGVSCEGIGASLWWPNKDHLSDEPDSMRIRCAVPRGLVCIANGVLQGAKAVKSVRQQPFEQFDWKVQYPINNYNVTLNIGDYVSFTDTFVSPVDGSPLRMDYYVMPYNLEKAKIHFKQAHTIVDVFERYLGKYPFYKDGYALVETSYAGMEHQSAIAYGNRYMPGYAGRHPSGVPVDFIILHETGHEWWGNSVSCVDHGEMWLHETFTTYMESVYAEDQHGYEAAQQYLKYYGSYIKNQQPMLGLKAVNFDKHDTDMYYKGALMLNTLRHQIDDDKLWWKMLKGYYQKHKHGFVQTEDYLRYVEAMTGKNYDRFFEHYLYYPKPPKLLYKLEPAGRKWKLSYKWEVGVENFEMDAVFLWKNKRKKVVASGDEWRSTTLRLSEPEALQIDNLHYYITSEKQ